MKRCSSACDDSVAEQPCSYLVTWRFRPRHPTHRIIDIYDRESFQPTHSTPGGKPDSATSSSVAEERPKIRGSFRFRLAGSQAAVGVPRPSSRHPTTSPPSFTRETRKICSPASNFTTRTSYGLSSSVLISASGISWTILHPLLRRRDGRQPAGAGVLTALCLPNLIHWLSKPPRYQSSPPDGIFGRDRGLGLKEECLVSVRPVLLPPAMPSVSIHEEACPMPRNSVRKNH